MSEVARIGTGGRRPRPLLRTLVGQVLRRHRLEQGRTLADVARAARVSMPYLSEVERGRKEASSEVLAAVCDALRIDLADVLADVLIDVGRGLVKDRASIVRVETARLDAAHGRSRTAPPARPSAYRSGDVLLLAA